MSYDLNDVSIPQVSGPALRLGATLLESSFTRWLVEGQILKDMGATRFREIPVSGVPTFLPRHPLPDTAAPAQALSLEEIAEETAPLNTGGFKFRTVTDFARAYRSGDATPLDVAKKVLLAIEQSETLSPPLNALISHQREDLLEAAQASTKRYAEGTPLGLFDGVPVAVKDELNQRGYPTTVGTSFLGQEPETDDATPVARFRAAGALLIGKANMHEIGIGVTGMNAHHGHARNPYDPHCFTGGSSSGSAVSVASGLCPVALGADGGGSIRIPAGLCGVVGLKATFGRISEHGAAPLCWSLAHVGPLGATIQDTALAYSLIAGEDPLDPMSQHQPEVSFTDLGKTSLDGIRIGVFAPWFEHADPEVVKACQNAVETLKERGAVVVPIEIPQLDLIRVAHAVLITSEMSTSMEEHYRDHRKEFGLDVRINLALTRRFTAPDYIKAQQVRTLAMASFNAALKQADVIVTPTTACTASPIPKSAIPHGNSDLPLLTQIMRYAFPGNITGLPGISVPAGYDGGGMPIGFQIMGRPWSEDLLLRLGRVVEGGVQRTAPRVHFDLLKP